MEYKIIDNKFFPRLPELEDEINRLAQDGWMIMTTMGDNILIMGRPRPAAFPLNTDLRVQFDPIDHTKPER